MPLDTRINLEEPASGLWKNAENPDVYVDIFGITHVVWVGETATGVKRIFYIFDDGNLSFNPSNTTLVGNIDRDSDNPKIGVNRSGRVVIVWEAENVGADGTDVLSASDDGALSLSVAIDISRNSGTGLYNRRPRVLINDDNKDPHFVWLGTHSTTTKTIPYYTKKNATTLIPTIHEVTPDIDHDCDNFDVALFGGGNQVFVAFQQEDDSTSLQNIRLSQGDDTSFTLLGEEHQDSLSLPILNRPSFGTNNTMPTIDVRPRITDVACTEDDDDPTVVVAWEDDDSPNHIKFAQRYRTDWSDGTVATSGVHRPEIVLDFDLVVQVAYYKAAGSNNIVNLSFKEIDNNQWTEASDIADGHASGDGLYNIVMQVSGCNDTYIAFKTGPVTGPQRVIHVNNFRTKSLFSFEIFAEELNTPSDTRSPVAMHLDDKIGNRLLLSDADSRAAIVFSDYTIDFAEPDGIGDVVVFGGVVADKPTLIAVSDTDGDNKPEFKWFIPGEHQEGFYDIYYRLCGASGIIPYEQDLMIKSIQFAPSGIAGMPVPGYIYTHEGASGLDFAELYGFGVRKRGGPWSEEFCFRLGDISVSNPTIIPPDNQVEIEKCDILELGGSAEQGSTIESQCLIEYSDAAGTIEINRTAITAYSIDAQGNYSGSLVLSLLATTASIRTEVIARDSEGNLSVPADSLSNLLVVENVPPEFESMELKDQTTCDTNATNSATVNICTVATGDVFEIKCWESVVAGGTGEGPAPWLPYAPILPFTFATSTDGTKEVFCRLRDSCGNESSILSAEIELDTVPPKIIAVTFDPATRRLTIFFNEPVTSLDLTKIRIVKG